jgi:hypothetical protein
VTTGFPKRPCSTKNLERYVDSAQKPSRSSPRNHGLRNQPPSANCWPLPREIAAALWQAARVNIRTIPRRFDFKRMFEASLTAARQSPAVFALTGIATMLIRTASSRKARQKTAAGKAQVVRHLGVAILVGRRIAEGG